MSLAPRERQALSAIETELRASDPVFAVLLARLADQLSPGREPRGKSWLRSLTPHRLTAGGAVLVIIATFFLAVGVAAAIFATTAGHVAPRPGHGTISTTKSPHGGAPFAW